VTGDNEVVWPEALPIRAPDGLHFQQELMPELAAEVPYDGSVQAMCAAVTKGSIHAVIALPADKRLVPAVQPYGQAASADWRVAVAREWLHGPRHGDATALQDFRARPTLRWHFTLSLRDVEEPHAECGVRVKPDLGAALATGSDRNLCARLRSPR
jgi:hypothetical protein